MSNKQRPKSVKRQPMNLEVKPVESGEMADLLISKQRSESPMFDERLMEEICERNNLKRAMKVVISNKGKPGIDGMTTKELKGYLVNHWLMIKDQLLTGRYVPKAIIQIEIKKPTGGKRKLSIPSVVDRFIQQAILQVLQSKWDAKFSKTNYGFRPGKSAHQAIYHAQKYIKEGYYHLVDIDLESFFDEINHDRLMSKLAAQIKDKRILKLIRMYLQTGIMKYGLITMQDKGASQGAPLSPFLSNIVLDELDKELEKRGHKYIRYADDANIYLKSRRAAERVMESISKFIERRLKLKVNKSKSTVSTPYERKFLGFTFTLGRNPNKIMIADQSIKRFKDKVRQLTSRRISIRIEVRVEALRNYLTGWKGYFSINEAKSIFIKLDGWIRRRLRCIIWKQWKTYHKRKEELLRRGVNLKAASKMAGSSKGPWRSSLAKPIHHALDINYFDSLNLPKLSQ